MKKKLPEPAFKKLSLREMKRLLRQGAKSADELAENIRNQFMGPDSNLRLR